MKNYCDVSCEKLVSILEKELNQLFLKLQENANQENIDAYFEKKKEYLFAKKKLNAVEN